MAASVAGTWAADMAGVATSRDRECFMRIYDHFMPRLCVYLRGLGAPSQGVYFTRPPRELIEELDALFKGGRRDVQADLFEESTP